MSPQYAQMVSEQLAAAQAYVAVARAAKQQVLDMPNVLLGDRADRALALQQAENDLRYAQAALADAQTFSLAA